MATTTTTTTTQKMIGKGVSILFLLCTLMICSAKGEGEVAKTFIEVKQRYL
jgi:hypothetical protein